MTAHGLIQLDIPSEDTIIMHKGKLVRFSDHVQYFIDNGFNIKEPITFQVNLAGDNIGFSFSQAR